ncbi:MAG: glycosyltransferase [Nitrospira sp.]|nr:glycosyltransferase [Nitrospira sp.]
MSQTEQPLISVVLCTYNRCDLMAAALRSVCEQSLAASLYEIIVVDNKSTDRTKEYVLGATRRYSQVRYCFEEKQGASHGRNAGVRMARGLYVACIDDDCTVPSDWLDIAKKIIEQHAPGLFGGPYRPFYNSPKPRWYRDSYGALDGGAVAREFGENEYLAGTNFFIRRPLLEQVGGFSPEFGGVGYKRGYGEEIVVQRRVRSECPKEVIYYYPGLEVCHLVRSEKMRLLWCANHMFAMGRDWQRVLNEEAQDPTPVVRAVFRGCRALLRMVKSVVWGTIVRDRSRFPCVENYLYEVAFAELRTIGMAYGQLIPRSG